MLTTALACSAAIAETGRIPSDQDTYPAAVVSIPAVLSQCFACHGPNGHSEYKDWPSLAGQKQAYLIQQLKDFKSGVRKHPMMQPVVAVLDEADMKTAAEYLSAQAPPQPSNEINKAVTKGAAPASAAVCVACHDNAALPIEPFLHAQQANYLAAQLHAFKTGTRKNEVMEAMVKGLNDKDISELAAYFSAQALIPSAKK